MRPSILDAAFDGVPNALSSGEQNNLAATLTPCNDSASTNDIADGFGRARDLYNRTAAARALATGEGATQTDIGRFNEALQMQEAYGGAVYDTVYEETAAKKRSGMPSRNGTLTLLTRHQAAMAKMARAPTLSHEGAMTELLSTILMHLQLLKLPLVPVLRTTGRLTVTGITTATTWSRDSRRLGLRPSLPLTLLTVRPLLWPLSRPRTLIQMAWWTTTELASYVAGSTFNTALNGVFDAEGKLQFAQSVTNTRSTATTDNSNIDDSVAGSANIDTLGEIVDHLSTWDRIVAAADKIVADADSATVSDYEGLQRRAARAKAARSHVQAEMDRLLGVVRVQNRASGTGADATTEVAILRSYDSVLGELRSAENVVRSTAAALEAARGKVKESLESAGSYLSQLVKLREYEKAQLIDLHDGTPPDSLLKAANEALEKAEMQQAAHAALAGETDNPANALLNELLKPAEDADGNAADDDGQALITAIADTYDTAKSAEDTAMNAMNAVEGLGGEDGAVAMNTAAIMENADNIMELDGRVTQNEENIAGNTTMIGENRTMIGENRTMIGENRGMIVTNAENIMTNASEIMRVEGRVDTNWDAIAANQMAISDNSASISSNADAIAANMNSIGSNTSAIGDNRNMIGELSDDLDVVRAGVAASMALAGMPAINGRGVSIGVGSFDGESAFAVGFQIQGEMASFKVGVTSASGATGASAGVGFQF